MLSTVRKSTREVLITGGAGFMGAHLASQLLATTDARITLLDDLADPGALRNVEWLKGQASEGRLTLARGGLRHALRVADAASSADEIYFLAGDLRAGDDLGSDGTLVVLEAARRSTREPVMICASAGAWAAETPVSPQRGGGIAEKRASGGSSTESLIRGFAQTHQLPAVALRMDTVAGPRQFSEPGDWVTRAEYAVLSGRSCCLPVHPEEEHDVLHVADAVHAVLAARAYIGKTAGKAYIVGGSGRRVTVEEAVHLIERVCHQQAHLSVPVDRAVRAELMAGHANTVDAHGSMFAMDTAWRPRRNLEETVREIAAFWRANREAIAETEQAQRVTMPTPRARAALRVRAA